MTLAHTDNAAVARIAVHSGLADHCGHHHGVENAAALHQSAVGVPSIEDHLAAMTAAVVAVMLLGIPS